MALNLDSLSPVKDILHEMHSCILDMADLQGLFTACFICMCFQAVTADSFVQVRTDVGTFEGFVSDVDYNGTTRPLVQFLGVPFAEPPTGQRRFAKPEPKANVEGVYNATYYRPACAQGNKFFYYPDAPEYSEDCLYLNIYIPGDGMNISTENYPVMIWIHGGGLTFGYANLFIPDALSSFGDVIVVTFNYRVSVFGFFHTGDSVSAGNYGLWDQHLAIKWVHDYVSNFGGDPDTITVFGESAGAVSVLLQAMFPKNTGLFRRIIAESGSHLPNNTLLEIPKGDSIGIRVGCPMINSTQLVQCLRSKDMQTLVDVLNDPLFPMRNFLPRTDGDFIKRPPRESLQNRSSEEYTFFSSLDLLAGVNDFEGYFYLDFLWRSILEVTDENYPVTTSQFDSLIVPFTLESMYGDNFPSYLADAVIFQYTDWSDVGNMTSTRDLCLQLISDANVFLPTFEYLDIHEPDLETNSTTFFYVFTVPGYFVRNRPQWMTGAVHGDEVFYVFGMSKEVEKVYNLTASPEDIAVAVETMKLFTNFAKSGNPNQPVTPSTEWPHYKADTRDYLEIGQTSNAVRQRFNEPYTSFWTYMVPALLREKFAEPITEPPTTTMMTTPPTTTTTTAEKTTTKHTTTEAQETEKKFSDRFNMDSTTADNVIIVLIVVSGCLFVLGLGSCVLLLRKNNNGSKYAL